MRSHNPFNDLSSSIQGEVYDDPIRTSLLATDGSIFSVTPAAVVYPKDSTDVVKTVQFALQHALTIHARGAGSGLCGSSLGKGIILDFTKYMNRLFRIDIENKWFECEPGFRMGELEAALNGSGLFFPPDPSSAEFATFGGMYATNASGAHSVKYGNVSDYILDAEIVFGDGKFRTLSEISSIPFDRLSCQFQALHQLYMEHAHTIESAYPNIRCNVSGYNLRGMVKNNRLDLRRLFAGSEGTLGIATRLRFRLLNKPCYDSLIVAFFDNVLSSVQAVQAILPMGPSGIEIMDKSLLNLAKQTDNSLKPHIPDGIDNLLMVEFDSMHQEECATLANAVKHRLLDQRLAISAFTAVSTLEKEKFWAVRKAAVPILYRLKGKKKVLALIEDAAVPTDHMPAYIKGLYDILTRHRVNFVLYGHIAKGLLHTRPLLDLSDSHDVALLKILADDVFDLVDRLNGTISGEHGDGRIRSPYISRQYPELFELFVKVKHLLDERAVFNPDIKTVCDSEQMKKHLRTRPLTSFWGKTENERSLIWSEGFLNEVEKCHGCSKCTTITSATRMCPVYKVTRDEAAAPKAKANSLRTLINGGIPDRMRYEKAFRQIMDACIGCGSCYQECPSGVNIPKMVLEATSDYVQRFGASVRDTILVQGELAGSLLNQIGSERRNNGKRLPIRWIKRLLGVSPKRKRILPSASLYHRVQFKEGNGNRQIVLFAGCYASYFRPEIGEAAVKVLNHLGFTVYVPQQHCCGLPMISKGMTEPATRKISANIEKWGSLLNEADHLVVTCSSCGLALTQEWGYLMRGQAIETVRQKVIHISSLINRNLHRWNLPVLKKSATPLTLSYHQPCHLRVQSEPECSMTLLSRIETVKVEDMKSHCCGMAGIWGMTAEHYDLSRTIGSDLIHKLNGSNSVIGVTDCPTCRIQMEDFSHKPIRHPVEIFCLCLSDR